MQVKQNWKISVQYIMILCTALQLEAEHKSDLELTKHTPLWNTDNRNDNINNQPWKETTFCPTQVQLQIV